MPWSSMWVERDFGCVCLLEGACGIKRMMFQDSLNLCVGTRAIFIDSPFVPTLSCELVIFIDEGSQRLVKCSC